MQRLTFLVLAGVLAVALGAGQYYVPRSYYLIDEDGHQSAPVALRRLRRSAYYPSPYYPPGGANANANANANAKADGAAGGDANANANAIANANAEGREPSVWGGGAGAGLGWGASGRGASGGGWGNDWTGWVGPSVGASNPGRSFSISPGDDGYALSRRPGSFSGARSVSAAAGASVDVDGLGNGQYEEYAAIGH